MFCFEKLIDTEKRDLLHKLVQANCITSGHRDRVICSKPEDRAYELLIILQRRRYKDYFNFMDCLRKTMQQNMVKILEKGGVTAVNVQLLQEREDKRDIEAELVNKLTRYIDEGSESELSDDQRNPIHKLLAELQDNDICFIGSCTSNSGLSMFFQGETDDSSSALNNGCESGSLKNKLESWFRSSLEIPERWPPLVKEVTTGQHSNKHQVTTETEQNSGELRCIEFYQ